MSAAWRTHQWIERVVVIGGERKREYFCIGCERRMVQYEHSPGKYFAAYAGIFDFEPLTPDITIRWLNEPCPGQVLMADIQAYESRPRRNWRAYFKQRRGEFLR